ncbi:MULTISPECIES: STAS domain-containing protein [Sanguibacter]|uniref:STAS domain-containing protein n=2 Tax=Sanguibacter TaxID=60919 RepID=A0A853ETM7_9MICO|nr:MULTISPECIES: STAS domain-containing protein [Sanguibacter]MBF0721917.1 STAS domain-containing protein [Sanguibacter inulinus]NYS93062.1 STAS domain-containing protein [Sanguibacter inulinus]WPF83752.1 STAS domain-containing protein [Sanguibacter sp. 4.1]
MDSIDTRVSGIGLLEEPGRSVLQMWGEVDSALRPDASGALARALDRNLPVVIDTSKVEFIDSTGIAFLVQVCTIGRDEGLDVTLVDPPAVVSDVLAMLGVDELVGPQRKR